MSGYLKIPIVSGGGGGAVDSVNGQTGDVVLTKSDIGLGNVTNTSDANKPVSTAQQSAIDLSISNGGAYYLTSSASPLGAGRYDMTKEIPAGGGFGISKASAVDTDLLAAFASVEGYPNSDHIPSGSVTFNIQARKTAGTKTAKIYAEFYSRTILGVNTLLATTHVSAALTGSNTMIYASAPMDMIKGLGLTDRLLVEFKINVSGAGTAPDVTMDIQGTTCSRAVFPFDPADKTVVDNLVTLSGVPANDVDLGTFTGSTIPDNSDIKEALQALEDATEAGLSFPLLSPTGGSNTAPIYAFSESGDDTGMYSEGDGNISFTANAQKTFEITPDLVNVIGADLDVDGNITANNYPPTGNNNAVAYFNPSGDLASIPNTSIYENTGGFNTNLPEAPNGTVSGYDINSWRAYFEPLQDSPDETYSLHNSQLTFDNQSSGFDQGTNGSAAYFHTNNVNHPGTGDLGSINFYNINGNLGNGTDPVNVKGFSFFQAGMGISANTNINGNIQGYGFSLGFNSAATMINASSIGAFFDQSNVPIASPNYSSFAANPNISEIQNNSNYLGLGINPTIDTFTGNSNFNGVSIGPNLGTFGTGSFTGVNVNPNIDAINYAQGLFVSMDNVTVTPGAPSALVIQDLTITFNSDGNNNNITIEYVDDTTAGSETATFSNPNITVHIEDGVSTASQVKAAIEANFTLNSNLTVTISGVGSNPQVAQGPTNLTGGQNPGNKKAAYLDGDVEITGALAFGGALSVGQFNAFYSYPIVSGSGNPASGHFVITQPTLAANESRTLADFIGVNTAMLLTMGDNSSITTAFLGLSALALPAVVSMGTGATVDRIAGATFALSLDAGGTGGTIDQLSLCRSISIPNGATTVTRQYGYEFSLPFGDAATDSWGVYMAPDCHNWMKGSLRLGGTEGSDDTADSGYKFHNDGNSYLQGNTQFDGSVGFYATAPVAQQSSSGPQTAGGTYTATEQVMIQEMYDALRAYGLLS